MDWKKPKGLTKEQWSEVITKFNLVNKNAIDPLYKYKEPIDVLCDYHFEVRLVPDK